MALHKGLKAQVLVNGFASTPFLTAQGLPQGDPLSPLLYNLVLEPFLCHLRATISGLPLIGLPFICSAFADDVAVGISSPQDRKALITAISLHEQACNAKLNITKSEFLPLSSDTLDTIPTIGLVLARDKPFKHLGITFHPQCFPLPQSYFDSLLNSLQSTIANWQKRKLSLIGKVLILNSRLLSKLWYISYHVSFPPYFFPRVNRLLTAFLWNGKRAQMSLDYFFTAAKQGGMGLLNPAHHSQAIKAWWYTRIITPTPPPWQQLSLEVFKTRYAPSGWGLDILATSATQHKLRHKGIWADMVQAWRALNGSFSEELDPLTYGETPPLTSSSLAGGTLEEYKINTGSSYLRTTLYPLLENHKWQQEDPNCAIDWTAIWEQLQNTRKHLPPQQVVLWWRLLHHNIMTANRTAHFVPGASNLCRHCNSAVETPGHLFYSCHNISPLWEFIFSILTPFSSLALPPLSLSVILSPFSSFPPSLFPVLSVFFGYGFWSIWRSHWALVFDYTQCSPASLRAVFISQIFSHVTALAHIAHRKGDKPWKDFQGTWKPCSLFSISDDGKLCLT